MLYNEIPYLQHPLNGETVIVGTMGDPIVNTISPQMQGAAFAATGMNMVYLPFPVTQEALGDAVRGIRALGIRGVNVTMPHKERVMEFLDELDPLAKAVGCVNAIINTDGVLKGYNYDVEGFLRPLEGMELSGRKTVLLGSGGGARAAAFGLATRGAELLILNRHGERAQALAQELAAYTGTPVRSSEWKESTLKEALKDAELLVNCTSIGFGPQQSETPVSAQWLHAGMTVYDIVFSPLETRLTREAAVSGVRTITGLEMLVSQGALFFEKVTGKTAPVALMRETARAVLEERQKK